MGIWGKLRAIFSKNQVGGLEDILAKDQKRFRKDHEGHKLVVACLSEGKGIVEHTVPLSDVWQGKVSIAMLIKPGEVPIGVRCSCHTKGMYAALPTTGRDLMMRLSQQGQGKKELVN